MSKTKLVWIVIMWALLTLFNYYYSIPFVDAFIWLGLSLTLIIFAVIQLIKLIHERKTIPVLRIQNAGIFITLFLLTFFRATDKIIEKVDWVVFYSKRSDIVKQIKNGQLNPNVSWNGFICQLPFSFPIVSNGGNDIGIYRDKENGSVTVEYYISRGFIDIPSTQFIYTNDSEEIRLIEEKIKIDPANNWRINTNWFRSKGDL